MDPIQEWYCDCKAGSRVFGACSHVTNFSKKGFNAGSDFLTLSNPKKIHFFLGGCPLTWGYPGGLKRGIANFWFFEDSPFFNPILDLIAPYPFNFELKTWIRQREKY
ncbi:hypothetical protein BpHYR1_047559 [Brachionus plicatilis]|uniref:Uncharacterized protein n=1 Tax=Brachionus plicatilis TaxID=10195 RepID=A0A3M7SRF9_BRAPC|nr:hypothetical protein BpHYR1_047559 [Brachionus plicatilis]